MHSGFCVDGCTSLVINPNYDLPSNSVFFSHDISQSYSVSIIVIGGPIMLFDSSVSPHYSCVNVLILNMSFVRKGLSEIIQSKGGRYSRPSSVRGVRVRDIQKALTEGRSREDSEKTVRCRPKTIILSETRPACMLIMDLPAPRSVNK